MLKKKCSLCQGCFINLFHLSPLCLLLLVMKYTTLAHFSALYLFSANFLPCLHWLVFTPMILYERNCILHQMTHLGHILDGIQPTSDVFALRSPIYIYYLIWNLLSTFSSHLPQNSSLTRSRTKYLWQEAEQNISNKANSAWHCLKLKI